MKANPGKCHVKSQIHKGKQINTSIASNLSEKLLFQSTKKNARIA